MRLSPYILFHGECEAAFQFYAQSGIGAVTSLMHNEPSAVSSGVMHASFEGTGVHFYGADSPGSQPMQGAALIIETNDLAEATRLFGVLGEGGAVTMPLEKQFWGAHYGRLTDRFGVAWMVHCEAAA